MSERVSEGRRERAERIAGLKELFDSVQGGVLTDYRGLDMQQMTELRTRFREQGVGYRVVKNTLTRLALQQTDYRELVDLIAGPIAVAYTEGDPIVPAKVAVDFSKDHEALEIRGGFMQGRVLSEAEVLELSKIPGKQELMAQFLSVLNGPSQRLLGVFLGLPQKFLGVLKARAEQLEGN